MGKRKKRVKSKDATEKLVSEPKKLKLTKKQKVGYERELRRYVKRAGGFRKGLPEAQKDTARGLMKILDRKKPEWDVKILIPGYDKPTCTGMVIV